MHNGCSVFISMVTILLFLPHALEASDRTSQTRPDTRSAQVTTNGRIVDSQGRPVEGARVTLYQTAHDEMASLPKVETIQEKNTAADGAFSLTTPRRGNSYSPAFIIARKEGCAIGWAMWGTEADQRFDIVLGEPKDLAGDVVDEKGQPVADAEVSIAFAVISTAEEPYLYLLDVPGLLNSKTNNNGHFLFGNMPAGATFEFLVSKAGRVTVNTAAQAAFGSSSPRLDIARTASEPPRCQFSPGQRGIRLVLPLEARIEGTVVESRSGEPVGGVTVRARADQQDGGFLPPDPATTSEDGRFSIGGLVAGNHTLELATGKGQVAEWVAQPANVSLKANETKSGVKLELMKGGIIQVLVKDAGGRPVANAGVSIHDMPRDQYFAGRTDANGLVRMRVLSGQYHVAHPFQAGYALQMGGQQVTINEGETKQLKFILNTAPRVEGIVRDEAGYPLSGVKVEVTPSGREEITTAADGRFAVTWNPESVRLPGTIFVLVARDLARNLAEVVELDEQVRNVDIKLKRAAILAGRVLNQEGKALAGARILVVLRLSRGSVPLGLRYPVITSADGTFEIKALPSGGEYRLTAMADGYGKHEISINAADLTGNRQDVGQFRLASANLSISGIVVDSLGKPVAGAKVLVMGGSLPRRDDVPTGADGRFVIKGVSAGQKLLMVHTVGATRMYGPFEANAGASDVRIVVSE
jgi:protocatechuate 3,4-dioxygenase beta subunit